MRSTAFALALLLLPTAVAAEDDFTACTERLFTQARAAGIAPATLARLRPELEPLARVLRLDRAQPEFTQSFARYLDGRVDGWRLRRGRALLAQHARLLDEIEQRHAIDPALLVALWGLETNFGGNFGDVPVFSALATLACDGRRAALFDQEWLAALQLLEAGSLPLEARGSWSGAMGHMQFMPSTIAAHAGDHDGDGRIDLWRSLADAFGSAATYLRAAGWQPGEPWGREVVLPDDFDLALNGRDRSRPLTAWQDAGVTAAHGELSDDPGTLEASLLLPSGHHGPAFLLYPNFDVLLTWNASTFYALSVGLLADRLSGAPPLQTAPPDEPRLHRDQVEEMQERLTALGFDAGPADGVVGPLTRAALRDWQQHAGLPADGHPNETSLEALRNAKPFQPPLDRVTRPES